MQSYIGLCHWVNTLIQTETIVQSNCYYWRTDFRLKSNLCPLNHHPLNYWYFACKKPGLSPNCISWALTSAVSSAVPSSPQAVHWGSYHQSAACAQQALPPTHLLYPYLFSPTSFHRECPCSALNFVSRHLSLLSTLPQSSGLRVNNSKQDSAFL